MVCVPLPLVGVQAVDHDCPVIGAAGNVLARQVERDLVHRRGVRREAFHLGKERFSQDTNTGTDPFDDKQSSLLLEVVPAQFAPDWPCKIFLVLAWTI